MEGKLQQVTHPPEESTTEHREPVNKKRGLYVFQN